MVYQLASVSTQQLIRTVVSRSFLFPASHDLYPPTRVCLLFGCENYRDNDEVSTLTKPLTHPASLFTLSNGALPIHSTSLYCESRFQYNLMVSAKLKMFIECYRRYYLNYFVDKTSSQRVYYDGIPAIIEASPHAFIVTPLLEMFANAKMLGWYISVIAEMLSPFG